MNDKESKLIFEMYNETIINPKNMKNAEFARDMAETEEDREAAKEILMFLQSKVKEPGKVRELWAAIKRKYLNER